MWVALSGAAYAQCPAPTGRIVYSAEQELRPDNELVQQAVFKRGSQHHVDYHALGRSFYERLEPLGCGRINGQTRAGWQSPEAFSDNFVERYGASASWAEFKEQATSPTGYLLPGYGLEPKAETKPATAKPKILPMGACNGCPPGGP